MFTVENSGGKERSILHTQYAKYIASFVLLYALAIYALSGTGNQTYEHLHLLLDTGIGMLSLLLALFLLAEQQDIDANVRSYLAIGFAFAATTELLHAFVGIEWSGDLAWIKEYALMLRPTTWPPSTYVLPISILWAIWLMRSGSLLHPVYFVTGVGLVSVVLYIASFALPAYIDIGVLGIQRPTQIPVLFVLSLLVIVCWRARRQSRLYEGLAWMSMLLFVSDAFMLLSTSPHEKFAMISHVGKLLAYGFLHVIQMRTAREDKRARMRAETLLLQEEQNLRKAMNDLIFQEYALDQHAIVATTDVRGTITYANNSFSSISGYEREELIGSNHRLLKSGLHPEEFFRDMYRVIGSGNVWKGEICNRSKDGHLYWVSTTIVPLLDGKGKPKQYIALRTDISERKRAEAELIHYQEHLEELVAEQILDLKRAKEQAEAASRAKSDFLANMSHEIRTPMNGVVGMIDILQETRLTNEQQRMVDTIRNSSLALLAILGDILDFSKIEAGKLEIELIPVNLRELVEGVAQLLAPSVADKNMDLYVFVSPDITAWVYTDPGRVRQILFNLLGNAVKFTSSSVDRRGKIMMRVEIQPGSDGNENLCFKISDNGIGMTQETMGKLFKPFVQADVTTTRRFGGTGLGLSISRNLAELLDGTIDVSSEPDKGAEFIVILPLKPAPETQKKSAVPDLSGTKVLLLNVEHDYAEILPAYLLACGAQVKMVSDKNSALQVIRQSNSDPWDVLLDFSAGADIEAGLNDDFNLPVVRRISRNESAGELNGWGVAVNPLLMDELAHAVLMSCNRMNIINRVRQTDRRSVQRKTVPSITEAIAQKELILVAEDNDVSREVIQEQLRILGYASELAEDGEVALEMWRSGRFSLLLTDCHMPNLDGFGLAAAIRKEEAQGQHVCIIAVTGNAMQGEALRCMDSGMDDYMAKPLRLNELGAMLTKWLLPTQGAVAASLIEEAAPARAAQAYAVSTDIVWDASTLVRMVGDHPEMHKRLVKKFLSNSQEQLVSIQRSCAAGDWETVTGIAHKMKSAARTVGAMQLGSLCQHIEMSGKTNDIQSVATGAKELEGAYNAAVAHIRNNFGLTT